MAEYTCTTAQTKYPIDQYGNISNVIREEKSYLDHLLPYARAEADNRNQNGSTVAGDPVNHPSHYTSGKIEVIDFIEDQKLDFHLANALKYICRAGKKNKDKTKEDLEKAVWYINRYITHVLGENA